MRVFLFAVLTLAACLPVAATEIPGSNYSYGNWRGGAYTNDKTGYFSHCGVSTSYLNDHSLFFFVYENSAFTLGIVTPQPAFQPGQILPVRVVVDRTTSFDGEASAVQETFSVLRVYEDKKALEAIKRGQKLQVYLGGKLTSFDLSGTFRAIETTRKCAAYYRGYAGRPVSEQPARASDLVDQSILYQIATDQIARLGVRDSRYLSREESKQMIGHEGVFWISESGGLAGGVYVQDAGGMGDLKDSDPLDLVEISQGCRGDIVTGSRDVTADEWQTRQMRAICSQDKQIDEILVEKVLIENIILYTMLMFSDPLDSPAPDDREDERRQLSHTMSSRAASFVVKSR